MAKKTRTSSKYAEKIRLQKRGIFNKMSPFKPGDRGVSIDEMFRLRFKHLRRSRSPQVDNSDI